MHTDIEIVITLLVPLVLGLIVGAHFTWTYVPRKKIIKRVRLVYPSQQVGPVNASEEMWHFYRRAYEYGATVWSVAEANHYFGNDWDIIERRTDGSMFISTDCPPDGYTIQEIPHVETQPASQHARSDGNEPQSAISGKLGRLRAQLAEYFNRRETARSGRSLGEYHSGTAQ